MYCNVAFAPNSLLLDGGDTVFASTTPKEMKTVNTDAMTMRKMKKDALANALEGGGAWCWW